MKLKRAAIIRARQREASRAFKRRHPERVKASSLAWYYKEPGRHLLQRYGMTLADYHAFEQAQEGLCAICLKPASGNGKQGQRLHVDHHHGTRRVRGLLCGDCNRGLGLFKDSIHALLAAVRYLQERS